MSVISMESALSEGAAKSIVNSFKSAMGTIHKEFTGKSLLFLHCVNEVYFTGGSDAYSAIGLSSNNSKRIIQDRQLCFTVSMKAADEAYYAVQTIGKRVLVRAQINDITSQKDFSSETAIGKKVFSLYSKLSRLFFKTTTIKDFMLYNTPEGYGISLVYWNDATWSPFKRSVKEVLGGLYD